MSAVKSLAQGCIGAKGLMGQQVRPDFGHRVRLSLFELGAG
jgi:hypothetical protein